MQKYIIALLLLTYCCADTVVVKSDNTNKIGTLSAVSINSFPTSLIPGVVGIWNALGNASPAGTTLTFTKVFYLNCKEPATLSIAAYGAYAVWWDGVKVFSNSGANLAKYSLAVDKLCGEHNLTITVTKAGSTSGLIYAVTQDQSKCFTCNSNGYWNDLTCSCRCLPTGCDCPKASGSNVQKIWNDYPTCACRCPKQIIKPATSLLSIDVESTLTANFGILCPINQYYSELTCSCRCVREYCGPKKQFNDDPKSGCGCWDIIY